jgi:predicted phosphodiesterase
VRTAILSDVHANLQALNAVLTELFSVGADRIISLGDLVGYGPQPAEVLERAYAHINHFVLGNHDAVIAGRMDPAVFNASAREMIEWTAGRLDPKAAAFLAKQPYVLTGPSFRCSHGNPASPPQFGYVLEPEDAQAAWEAAPEQLLFVGHSHVPGLFVLGRSGTPHWLDPQDFSCEAHKRYIVNVGSVGQPRDGEIRATYCLYDDSKGEVRFHQVPFDLDAYREAMTAAAPPLRTAYFLQVAESGQPRPLREVLDFHPPTREAVRHEQVTVEHLGRAVRSARRWRLGAAALLVLLLTALACAAYLYRRARPEMVELAALRAEAMAAPGSGAGCLPAPDRVGPVTAEALLADWTVHLKDPSRQTVEVLADTKEEKPIRVFRLSSQEALPVVLAARPVKASAGMRFQVQATCRSGAPLQGYAELCLVHRGGDGLERPLLHCPLESLSSERWRSYRRSLPPEGLAQDGELRWLLQGEFAGELLVREPDLERTK